MEFISSLGVNTLIWVLILVFFAHFLGALTGFGCTILAMPVMILLVGIEVAKPLLLIMGTLQPVYLVIFMRRHIDWKVLKSILIITMVALPFGYLLYSYLPENELIIVLGGVMIFAGVNGLLKIRGVDLTFINTNVLRVLMFIGGVIQGAFVSGGPLIVIYASKVMSDKNIFRASLSVIWVMLNTTTIVQSLVTRQFSYNVNMLILVCLPVLFLSVWLGNVIANKVSKLFFDYLLNIVLIVGGIITIINKTVLS